MRKEDNPCIGCEAQIPCETCEAGIRYKEQMEFNKRRAQEWIEETTAQIPFLRPQVNEDGLINPIDYLEAGSEMEYKSSDGETILYTIDVYPLLKAQKLLDDIRLKELEDQTLAYNRTVPTLLNN